MKVLARALLLFAAGVAWIGFLFGWVATGAYLVERFTPYSQDVGMVASGILLIFVVCIIVAYDLEKRGI